MVAAILFYRFHGSIRDGDDIRELYLVDVLFLKTCLNKRSYNIQSPLSIVVCWQVKNKKFILIEIFNGNQILLLIKRVRKTFTREDVDFFSNHDGKLCMPISALQLNAQVYRLLLCTPIWLYLSVSHICSSR
jgi:hypothetical protein